MSLPTRGTGLSTGRARTTRGMGNRLTDAQRRLRHYGAGSLATSTPYLVAGLLVASGLILLVSGAFKK